MIIKVTKNFYNRLMYFMINPILKAKSRKVVGAGNGELYLNQFGSKLKKKKKKEEKEKKEKKNKEKNPKNQKNQKRKKKKNRK